MVAWAAAAFGANDAGTEAVATAFGTLAGAATPQQLATTARAFAKLGTLHLRLMDATADAVLAMDKSDSTADAVLAFKPQDVANIAWAFAKLGCKKKKLFDFLSEVARAHLKQQQQGADAYTPQHMVGSPVSPFH